MSRETLAALGGGAASGLLYLLALAGLVGAALLVQFPLFLAGLGLGLSAALIACTAGAVLVLIVGGPAGAVNYALASAAPVLVVTRQALLSRPADGGLEWYPPGLLVTWLAGLAIALVVAAAIWFSGTEGGLEGYARQALSEALAPVSAADPARGEAAAAALAPIAPGLAMAGWLFVIAVNGALAQAALARLGRNRRPSPRMEDIELPPWVALALAGALAAAFFGGPVGLIGRNALIILGTAFFFAGLGVVHALVRKLAVGVWALLVFYVVMAMFGWPVIMVAGLGLADQWIGFRARWRAKGG